MVTEFIGAALPWIAMGLLLAVFFARGARRKKGKREEYGSEGMALGMCFGVAVSTALHVDVGLGMIAGTRRIPGGPIFYLYEQEIRGGKIK